MTRPAVFGYGSLVNTRTHDYADPTPVRLTGWRREWVQTTLREVCFLSVVPEATAEIDGLVATVPDASWEALDAREHAYDRADVTEALGRTHPVALYHVSPGYRADHSGPILLSYLDVVVQGYLDHFGLAGARRFFETTGGWDRPIRDDRSAPVYARAQTLTAAERRVVDDGVRLATEMKVP